MAAHALAQPPRLCAIDPACSPRVDAVVAAMLSKHPLQRPTMTQLAVTLSELAAQEVGSAQARPPLCGETQTVQSPRIEVVESPQGCAGTIAIIGEIEDSVLLALGAAGYRAERRAHPGDAELALVAAPSTARLRTLLSSTAWIVVSTPAATDFSVISHLLEAGVRDVVAMPHRPEDVVRKISRLLVRKRRGS